MSSNATARGSVADACVSDRSGKPAREQPHTPCEAAKIICDRGLAADSATPPSLKLRRASPLHPLQKRGHAQDLPIGIPDAFYDRSIAFAASSISRMPPTLLSTPVAS